MTTPAGTIRRKNPRLQGEIGLGAAIAWFASEGYGVSIPLCDNRAWDLIVDEPETGALLRVQVKTTTARNRYGRFEVDLRTNGGNQSFTTSKPYDPEATDLLFVFTDAREVYIIPNSVVTARSRLTLGLKWERYKRSDSGWGLRGRVVGEGFEPS